MSLSQKCTTEGLQVIQLHYLMPIKYTVEPCILEQIEHLWGPAVSNPMILLTKSSNMTLDGYIGLQHIQKSAS